MNAITKSTDQRNADWHAERVSMVTGSRVAAILGIPGAFGNRHSVMREMVRESLGAEREFKGNVATEWGNDNEPRAIEAYEAQTGAIVEPVGFCRHPSIEWLGASPDGLLAGGGVIEVKCPYGRRIKAMEESPHYYAQVQVELACTDRAWCDFVVWTPDELHIETVYLSPNWLDNHLTTLRAFYDEFQTIIATPDLQAPYLQDAEVLRDDFEWTELASQYRSIDEQIKALQDEQKAIRAELVEMAGGQKSKGAGVTVFETKRAGTVDYKAMLKDHKEIDPEKYRGKASSSWSVRLA